MHRKGHLLGDWVPVLLGSVFQQLYNTADALIVGRMLGSQALAAVSATGVLVILLISLFSGISTGAGVLVSKYYGARDDEDVSKGIHTELAFDIVMGCLLTLIGIFLTPIFLRWMGTPEEILPMSVLYLRVYYSGSICLVLYNGCRSIMIMLICMLTGCGAKAKLTEVQLMTPADKTEYLVGESFDPEGLVLIGVYSDGSRQKFTEYTYDKTGPLTKEDTVVTIKAGEQSFEQPISVITPAEKIVLIPVNGVDTLEMYADGHIAVVGGAGTGSLLPEETYWSWDGETLRIWLTNYAIKASTPDQPMGGVTEDHMTEMELVKNDVGDITFEYDIRGSWHMNYTITAASMEEALTPDVRYPIADE